MISAMGSGHQGRGIARLRISDDHGKNQHPNSLPDKESVKIIKEKTSIQVASNDLPIVVARNFYLSG